VENWIWVLIAIAVVLVVLLVAAAVRKRQQEKSTQSQFGPEYERTVQETGSRREAISELRKRAERRQQLDIRPLEPDAARRYNKSWQETQRRFVDYPGDAIQEADSLVAEVMQERGYPVEDFEQRAADVSVDHSDVVGNYRAAHAIAIANDQGKATTEDLRQAMVHYRSLFQDLLETAS
jgi:hypothetical protein